MTKELAKQDDFDMGIDFSDMMMMIMMIMMIGIMSSVTQTAQTQTQALQAQSFVGNEDPRTVRVSNRISWINLIYDYPYQPWISAYIINDGPNPVEIGINFPDDMFTLNPGETITITRFGAEERIKILYFLCGIGRRSIVRITGAY